MTPVETVLQFIEAINEQDVERMAELMTPGHTIIEVDGSRVHGRETMKRAWRQYFRMFPDYSVSVSETFSEGKTVIVVGEASGTYAPSGELLPENRWKLPAAWKAVTEENKIDEWQIFADLTPVLKVMSKKD